MSVCLYFINISIVVEKPDKVVKNKINKRNRLLKQFKLNPNVALKEIISNLNYEIKSHFFAKQKFKVRKNILPNNSKSLWQAVKKAKNECPYSFPPNMIFNGNRITGAEISECFAEFFDKKVLGIVESTKVDQGVYNGRRKIHAEDGIFMTSERIIECVKSLKINNAVLALIIRE